MKLKMTTLLSDSRLSSRWVSRFRKDENGSLIIFSLFMFVLILWLGGMAVDLIRFETTRAKLQGTLDRATLAAADLDQSLPCVDVVEDYFAKAGMSQFLDNVDCQQGLNYRVVSASAEANMPLFFYDIPRIFSQPFSPGLTTLNVSGVSTAEERVTDVEVSLILDVSSSMNSNNRITNLRPAAKEFVTTVLANNTNAPQGLITVSMIPYSAVVNPGPLITPHLDIDKTHEYSACPLFEQDSLFSSTVLDLGSTYNHVSHFDPDWFSADIAPIQDPWCHTGSHNSIIPVTSDETILHNAIDALSPYGNTAIDMGMRWGVGLLDPSTRSIITALAGAQGTNVEAISAGRPYDHTQPDVAKVVVLMTDGANTSQYDLLDRFKNDTSFVWFDMSDGPNRELYEVSDSDISIQYDGIDTPLVYTDDEFYWNGTGSFRTYPRGYSSNNEYKTARENGGVITEYGVGPTYEDDMRNVSWQELFANWEHNRVNNEILLSAYYAGAIPWSAGSAFARDQFGNILQDPSGNDITVALPDYRDADNAIDYSVVNSTRADARLSNLCAAARDEGIIIYTVAFEAPSGGQAALQDCAATSGRYFDVDGTDIATAFSAIASDIRALKLTQ